jgi:hypothetical protein
VSEVAPAKTYSAAAAGALVAYYTTGALLSRRQTVLGRLRQLRDSEEFEQFPDDLQQRIREIINADEH